jgi:sugar-specific transcriptional regulator TrmB
MPGPDLDLIPFGFTPTESATYGALLEAGPSSGYAVAKLLSIARANAYQALNGLVAKHAAELSAGEPRVYRAVQPSALFTRLSRDAAGKLATLERQIDAIEAGGAPDTISFRGEAEFKSMVMRLAVREEASVSVVAPAEVLRDTLPVWRARAANDRPTSILCVGPAPAEFPIPVSGDLSAADVRAALGLELTIVATVSGALLSRSDGGEVRGYWTSDPIFIAAARGAVRALTD